MKEVKHTHCLYDSRAYDASRYLMGKHGHTQVDNTLCTMLSKGCRNNTQFNTVCVTINWMKPAWNYSLKSITDEAIEAKGPSGQRCTLTKLYALANNMKLTLYFIHEDGHSKNCWCLYKPTNLQQNDNEHRSLYPKTSIKNPWSANRWHELFDPTAKDWLEF